MKWILTGEINSFHLKAQSGWAGNEHSVPKHCEKKKKERKWAPAPPKTALTLRRTKRKKFVYSLVFTK